MPFAGARTYEGPIRRIMEHDGIVYQKSNDKALPINDRTDTIVRSLIHKSTVASRVRKNTEKYMNTERDYRYTAMQEEHIET